MVPTKEQERFLLKSCGVSRFAYNWALARYIELKAAGQSTVSITALKKEFNNLKATKFPWVYESPKDANQQPFAFLQKNLQKFYRARGTKTKIGFPKFQSKHSGRDSFYVSNDKFRLSGKVVILPIIGKIKLTEKLRFNGKILSATVSKKADGWYISISVELPDTYTRKHECCSDQLDILGADWGLKTFLTLSNGESIVAPEPLKSNIKRLARYQRDLSRKQKGSKNRDKAKLKVAKLHQRIANIRLDFLHKLTTALARSTKTLVIEDLNIKGMMKNRSFSRKIADLSPFEFKRQCQYKFPLFGGEVIEANRWFPSSKTCSECGSVKTKLTLDERAYICEQCGCVIDRDLNAAINLAHYGSKLIVGAASPDSKPVEIEALATDSNIGSETLVNEAGIIKRPL
jgi:putative transposase